MTDNKITKGGKLVKLARTMRGYNRAELAELTGFAVNTIYNWEAGRARPSYDDVDLIIKTLHFTISELEGLPHAA
ncbi:hypothetical protein [Alteromonas phage P24]|nr:helix-turn-helix transcriptional regulator [Pseudomonadota bacterium]QIV64678.1 hypothetical protein [Alteromonas phage P24]